MKIPGKQTLIAAGVAGAIALGAAGAVMAQSPGTGGEGAAGGQHAGGPLRDRVREHLAKDAVKVASLKSIIEASGLDAEVFRAGFADGQSINQILTANGVNPATVQAAVIAKLETKLDELVASGKMDQARADEILAGAPARISEEMARVPDPEQMREHIGKHLKFRGAVAVVRSAAETLGITPKELTSQVRTTGGTIATVAESMGVDPQLVIDNAIADANAKLDEAVAAGKLDAGKAEKLKAGGTERITRFVNEGGNGGARP